MLTPDLVDALQAPISEASPCGDDLEYDPAFTAAETAALGKPEQQFGDTVIPPVDPDWNQVGDLATELLRRTKDVRPAVLLLRTSTRRQGVAGFGLGMQLLTGLLERHWDGIHPQLDADDDNDPTMRLNALAPLSDESLVPRDLYDALIGNARSVGPLRVRDVAVARNALAPVGDAGYSPAQVQGALEEILASDPDTLLYSLGLACLATLLLMLGSRLSIDSNRLPQPVVAWLKSFDASRSKSFPFAFSIFTGYLLQLAFT